MLELYLESIAYERARVRHWVTTEFTYNHFAPASVYISRVAQTAVV